MTTTYEEAFEASRSRLIALAAADKEGRSTYTGSAVALGFTHRADDLVVVWTGDSAFVVIPNTGDVEVQDLCPDQSLMGDMIESMCADGIGMCELVANVHRLRVAQAGMAA